MALVLIVLGLANRVTGRMPLCYPVAIAFTGVTSVLYALNTAGLRIPGISTLVESMPLYDSGLVWLIPAAVGAGIGAAVSCIRNRKKYGTLLLPEKK